MGEPLGDLDFIYLPSADAARDLAFYTDVLGGEVGFAIEAFGTRVAEVRVAKGPRLVLAEHLGPDEQPLLVHRVDDLEAKLAELEARGLEIETHFEFPHGPAAALRTPGGQRIALYELTRPGADERLAGRRDF
jgi:catechol 2,3-dioxygenase-like lactoylglutathione lyase family enzyme